MVCADSRSLRDGRVPFLNTKQLDGSLGKQPNTNIKESAFKDKGQAVADFQTHTSTATLVDEVSTGHKSSTDRHSGIQHSAVVHFTGLISKRNDINFYV